MFYLNKRGKSVYLAVNFGPENESDPDLYQLKYFKDTLPKKPFCADDYHFGKIIRDAKSAVTRKHIQPNSPFEICWITFDCDSETALMDWDDNHCPPPNIVAVNPENGHAHLFYSLKVPVHVKHGETQARVHPLRYLAAIDGALTKMLQADKNYKKELCKNPLHPFWQVYTIKKESYDLGTLASWVLPADYDYTEHVEKSGYGRHCDLFDQVRFWAYKEIRYFNSGTYGAWYQYVKDKANELNKYKIPLPSCDIRSVAKSVSKYVWNNMSSHSFKEWGEARRKRSIEVRHGSATENAERALFLRSQGKSHREIAEVLGVTRRRIGQYLGGGKFVISDDSPRGGRNRRMF
jgi:hypothetical protein